jgi:hypothetical protein
MCQLAPSISGITSGESSHPLPPESSIAPEQEIEHHFAHVAFVHAVLKGMPGPRQHLEVIARIQVIGVRRGAPPAFFSLAWINCFASEKFSIADIHHYQYRPGFFQRSR